MRGLEQIPWLYDALMALSERTGFRRWRQRLLDRVATGGSPGAVLEVGCGTGRNLPAYPRGARLVGLDPCLASLLAARRKAPGVPLVLASAEALPFRATTFRAVVSSLVFCSVPDPSRGLAEVDRVLEPAGHLHMLEHVRHRRPTMARLQDWIQPAWTRITGGCYPNRDTESTVERAGFRIHEDRRAHGTLRLFTASRPSFDGPSHPTGG